MCKIRSFVHQTVIPTEGDPPLETNPIGVRNHQGELVRIRHETCGGGRPRSARSTATFQVSLAYSASQLWAQHGRPGSSIVNPLPLHFLSTNACPSDPGSPHACDITGGHFAALSHPLAPWPRGAYPKNQSSLRHGGAIISAAAEAAGWRLLSRLAMGACGHGKERSRLLRPEPARRPG
jgi:hypothetical protein